MTTKLDKPLRRELEIDGKPYTLTIDAVGLKLVEKGRRKGDELRGRTSSAAMLRCRRR